MNTSLIGFLPLLFAFIYGSGFVGAKYALPYSDPLSFLSLRFALAAGVIALIALTRGAFFPRGRALAHVMTAGALTSGVFSIGSFMAIYYGISPALSALVISLQPIVVGLAARKLLGERLSIMNWAGLTLGLVGVALVLWARIHFDGLGLAAVLMAFLGLLGVSLGNLYQKKFCADMDVFAGGAIQSATAGLLTFVLSLLWGTHFVHWAPELVGSLLYMALGVSVGALSLLFVMIKRDQVTKVASIYYLVPVFAALASFLVFGQTLDRPMIVGMLVVSAGVWLARRA